MNAPPLNPNVIALLKKMATDPTFLASLEQAKTLADRKAIMTDAGISVDFTTSDVVDTIQYLTQPPVNGHPPPRLPEGAPEWITQLAKVTQSLMVAAIPA